MDTALSAGVKSKGIFVANQCKDDGCRPMREAVEAVRRLLLRSYPTGTKAVLVLRRPDGRREMICLSEAGEGPPTTD